jgi:hypothetical protein
MGGSGPNLAPDLVAPVGAITALGATLTQYSSTYGDTAIRFSRIPDGGDAEIDQAMLTFFQGVQDLHRCAAYAMENQGAKLSNAVSDCYSDAEAGITESINNLFKDAEEGPPVSAPVTGATTSSYLPSSSKQKPPLVQLNPADTTPNAPPVGPSLYHFLLSDTDTTGLDDLANKMRTFVATQGNPAVMATGQEVNSVVMTDSLPGSEGGWSPGSPGSPGWMGIAAFAFYQTFIANAATMNGFHHVICEVANLLQSFAAKMSDLESQLENDVRQAGQQIYPAFDLDMVALQPWVEPGEKTLILRPGVIINDINPAGTEDKLNQICIGIYNEYKEKANAARHSTAGSLIDYSELLGDALTFYTDPPAQSPGDQGITPVWVTQKVPGYFESSLGRETSHTNLSTGRTTPAEKAFAILGMARSVTQGGAVLAQEIGIPVPLIAELSVAVAGG